MEEENKKEQEQEKHKGKTVHELESQIHQDKWEETKGT